MRESPTKTDSKIENRTHIVIKCKTIGNTEVKGNENSSYKMADNATGKQLFYTNMEKKKMKRSVESY